MLVDVFEVSDAPRLIGADVDLLVVGGPTHAFGMSRPSTRKSAHDQASESLVSRGDGVREWLDRVVIEAADLHAATFDTRANSPRLPGTAAHKIRKRLKDLGVHVPMESVDFYVGGMQGPLLGGELIRAEDWGELLASARVTEVLRP
jgi:hypothetical protein